MANHNKRLDGLMGYEGLFVAIIKITIKHKKYEFFSNGQCAHLAEYLGLNKDIADLIKNRVAKLHKHKVYFK